MASQKWLPKNCGVTSELRQKLLHVGLKFGNRRLSLLFVIEPHFYGEFRIAEFLQSAPVQV